MTGTSAEHEAAPSASVEHVVVPTVPSVSPDAPETENVSASPSASTPRRVTSAPAVGTVALVGATEGAAFGVPAAVDTVTDAELDPEPSPTV